MFGKPQGWGMFWFAVIGILLNVWIAKNIDAEILLGGMFSGLASTGLYEAFRNLIKKSYL